MEHSMKKPKPTKGERVWVAKDGRRFVAIGWVRAKMERDLRDKGWETATIRRATLTLDPVRPKRRAK
jgi:hypothetical protein